MSEDVEEPWSEEKILADLDQRRVVALAKVGLMLSTMAGEGLAITGHDDAPDIYSEVLMALGIEDSDNPDIALEIARDHPEGCSLIERHVSIQQRADLRAGEREKALFDRRNQAGITFDDK